jgi:hypothetical protein
MSVEFCNHRARRVLTILPADDPETLAFFDDLISSDDGK